MDIEQCRWSARGGWMPQLPGSLGSRAQLVLVFGDASTPDGAACLRSLQDLYPHAQLFGASAAGEIHGTSIDDGTLSVTAVAFEDAWITTGYSLVEGRDGAFLAGAQAVSSLPRENLRHIFVLAPGNFLNDGDLVSGIQSVLPAGVTASGGFAGANGSVHGSLVWRHGVPHPLAVGALGFYGERLAVATGSGGGWRPFGPERRITKSAGQMIFELDRRLALELYKQYLGEFARGLPFTALRFPLGIRTSRHEPWQVRVIVGIDETGGGLAFDTNIPEGACARFLVGNAEHLVEGAAAAARIASRELAVPAQLSIVVSCYGRRVVLGQQTAEELMAAREVLGSATVFSGLYSYGEICRADGPQPVLLNQTFTLTNLAER